MVDGFFIRVSVALLLASSSIAAQESREFRAADGSFK
jgi:hypothetical protein